MSDMTSIVLATAVALPWLCTRLYRLDHPRRHARRVGIRA